MQGSKSFDSGLDRLGQMSTSQDGEVNQQPYDTNSQVNFTPELTPAREAHPGLSHRITQDAAVPTDSTPIWSRNHTQFEGASASRRPMSPSVAIAGAGLPEELLRSINLSNDDEKLITVSQPDPRDEDPSIGLSGNIISATFCVPQKIKRTVDGEWKLSNRKGTSALFDSFRYLASDSSKWKHTLVGWTGEIDRYVDPHGEKWAATAVAAATTTTATFNQAAAPIPINAQATPVQSHADVEMRISLADRLHLKEKLEIDQGGATELVWLTHDVDSGPTITLCNQHLWRQYGENELFTLFHYKQNAPDDGRITKQSWQYYKKMNKAFADNIVARYKPGDIVIVHDYQLMLLPEMLRKRVPTMYIAFFLHIPFPSYEILRSLTMRNEVLWGILGANMIGFQEKNFAREFTACCERILHLGDVLSGVDIGGAIVAVESFPIGIDTDMTHKSAFENAKVDEKIKNVLEKHGGKTIIVGRDRLDSLRGVAQKLKAFELFLERHPEWHERLVLVQVTSPTSAEKHEDEVENEKRVAELVARINGSFGSLTFAPVEHHSQYLKKEDYFALLRIANAALITSVRDGMNTTALEYVISQRDNHGPLIISEFSGTAANLNSAMRINPWDTSDVAETLLKALTLPDDEKAKAHEKLYNYVTTNNVQNWTNRLLKRLLTNLCAFDPVMKTPRLDRDKLLHRYRNSSRRLFLFDYDGTLTPIVRDPEAAIPSDRIIRTLKTLAADPTNAVWIISGRDQAFLDEYMGHISALGLSAEHGSFMRMPTTVNLQTPITWQDLTETLDKSWQGEAMEVFGRYQKSTAGSFIERKKIAITWHYRRSDPEFGIHQAENLKTDLEREIATRYEVDVMTGKANVEVRPRFVNKGEIVKRLVNEYGHGDNEKPDFVLCLGDDHTDEDMFRALRNSNLEDESVFATTVGPATKQTLAKYHLTEPSEVIAALSLLNKDGEDADSAADTVEARL